MKKLILILATVVGLAYFAKKFFYGEEDSI